MVSKLLRRIHMYLGLFLAPWMLMYALSTMAMNHREWFRPAGGTPAWVKESEQRYDGVFAEGAEPRAMARQLLLSLGLDGAHGASRRPDGTLVVNRFDLRTPRRITWRPADGNVLIERQEFRANAFLERFHRRRGYAQEYAADDLWAFSVDLVIATMLFWIASGLWLWWGIRPTRQLGALSLAGGALLFTFYLVML
jgi:hypothetical protein